LFGICCRRHQELVGEHEAKRLGHERLVVHDEHTRATR
jgi:hypothetical protein